MLKNAYFLAKIGADTAENERNFAKIWQLPHGSSAGLNVAAATAAHDAPLRANASEDNQEQACHR